MRYLSLFILLVIVGCGPTPYYSELHELDNQKWTTDEVLTFSPNIEDLATNYDLHLIIDHEQSYKYENVYFKILTKFPNGKEKEEQLSVDLADNKGQWVGNCSGERCKCKVYLLENFKFPDIGEYGFEIRQYTRTENLKGINGLEMQLFKVEASE